MTIYLRLCTTQTNRCTIYAHTIINRIKDDEVKLGLTHNDIYNTDELTHEFEYGLFEDIIKSEQLMADLKQIDEHEETLKEQMNQEFDYFPIEQFKDAGIVINDKEPELKLATQAELYTLEQQMLQQQQQNKCASTVSHVTNTMKLIAHKMNAIIMFTP